MVTEPSLELVTKLTECISVLKQVIPYVTNNTGEVARLDERMQSSEQQIQRIIKLVYDGSAHQPGLIQDIFELKAENGKLYKQLEASQTLSATNIGTIKDLLTRNDKHDEDMKKYRLAIFLGFLASATSIVVAIIK